MPIRLEPPAYRPGGPDGKGWNRLSLNAHMGSDQAECALRPRSYGTLHESRRDTRLAQWGGYGRCVHEGSCLTCPVFKTEPRRLDADEDKIPVRVDERTTGPGFNTQSYQRTWINGERWSWEELAHLRGWKVGRRFRDTQGEGFWLIKVEQEEV